MTVFMLKRLPHLCEANYNTQGSSYISAKFHITCLKKRDCLGALQLLFMFGIEIEILSVFSSSDT